MAGNKSRWMGWGLLLGAAVGAVWTWRRLQEMAQEGPPRLLDWERIESVASRFCTGPAVTPGQEAYYANLVGRSIDEVSTYTGQRLAPANLSLRVLDRRQWLAANVDTFRSVLQPLEDLYERVSSPQNPVTVLFGSPVAAFLSYQIGLLLGYLAQRVLGQYDIALLGREPLHDGQLYFVEPNIRAAQAQLGLSGPDFATWVALHETTHAFEFETHPWLRRHFNSLLHDYLSDLEAEVEHLGQLLTPAGLADLLQRVRQDESWLLWALTPRQRRVFDQMQALMCIVEGYSNYVMKQVGRRILPSFDLIEARVAARQAQRTPAERLFIRLTGLELKLEQYRLGEQFSDLVVQQRGLAFLQQVWQQAENLPTLEEINRPEKWIARMEADDGTAGR